MSEQKQSATSHVLQFRRDRNKLEAEQDTNTVSAKQEKDGTRKLSGTSDESIARLPGPSTWKLTAAGICTLGIFFGGLGYWSANAPLASAALAHGQVNIETNRKSVQHLEGGIVSQLLVREGQRVRAGDVLFVLDNTQPKANEALLRAKIEAAKQQAALLQDEITGVADLLRQGYSRKPRLLALKRQYAEIMGQIRQDEARLGANEDRYKRTELRAPVSGTVIGLKVHTVGGVIRAGEELLSIVPSKERLVVEARVRPNDIDVVHPGLEAQIRLTPYNARLVAPVSGTIDSISADAMKDEVTGQDYYVARVAIPSQQGEKIGDVPIHPGMPVEVSILTGSRTVADYMLAPLMKSFSRAFKED